MYPRPTEVRCLGDYRLSVTFEDGVQAELDFSPMVEGGGVFEGLKDQQQFAAVHVDPEAETLVWPTGADICPDVLYHLATGATLPGEPPSNVATLIRLTRPAAETRS